MSHRTRPRMIYPHLWDNPKFEGLGLDGFAVWTYMISQADDEGRAPLSLQVLSYRPFLVISGETKTSSEIEDILKRLEASGLCEFYRDESGRSFYQMHDFRDHQKVHKNIRRDSTYPAPAGYKDYGGTTEELRSDYVWSTEGLRNNYEGFSENPRPNATQRNVTQRNETHLRGEEISHEYPPESEGKPVERADAEKVAVALQEAAKANTGGKGRLKPLFHDADRIQVLLSQSDYSVDDLLAMVAFAKDDDHWRTIILTGAKLEKHADALAARILAAKSTSKKAMEKVKQEPGWRPEPPTVDLSQYDRGATPSPEHVKKVMDKVWERIGPPPPKTEET